MSGVSVDKCGFIWAKNSTERLINGLMKKDDEVRGFSQTKFGKYREGQLPL